MVKKNNNQVSNQATKSGCETRWVVRWGFLVLQLIGGNENRGVVGVPRDF